MKKIYKITGMTCGSCVEKVQRTLSEIDGVEDVKVSLNPPQAVVNEHHEITLIEINKNLNKLGGKYKAEEISPNTVELVTETAVDSKPGFKTYLPLILVFFYILLGISIIQINAGRLDWMNLMNNFMGGFFLVFSFFKMLDVKNFAYSYSSYDVIAKKWLGYGYVYPFIELTLGVLFLLKAFPVFTNWATLIVMGVSSIGVIQSLIEKKKIKCACLGTVFNLPMTNITLIEDLLMVLMSAAMLFLM